MSITLFASRRVGRSRAGVIFSIIFCLLIGIAISVAIASIYMAEQKFKSEAYTTEGTVVKIHTERRTNYRKHRRKEYYVYVPTVSYIALNGKKYECRTTGDKNPEHYQIGQNLKVYYNKINPASAHIYEEKRNWKYIVGITFAIFFIGLPIFTWIKRRPFNKAEWEKRKIIPKLA